MLVEIICASLTPLTPRELEERAVLLLDESWADVHLDEIDESAEALDDPAIDRDAWGYRAVDQPRSLDDAWAHLVIAHELAERVAATERRYDVNHDLRAQRQLFAAPLLARHQEIALGRRVRDGDQLARNALVEANTRWALQITRAFAGHPRGALDFDDLFEAGCLGLIRAAEKFDSTLGYKFSTYSTWWIRQTIQRSLADASRTIRVPVHVVERQQKLGHAARRLEVVLGREATREELAEATGFPVQHVDEARSAAQVSVSLNQNVGANDEGELGDFLADRAASDPFDKAEESLRKQGVRRVVDALPERERRILLLRFGFEGEPWTLEAIGAELGLTRERIRQIETDVLKRLRESPELAALGFLPPPASKE